MRERGERQKDDQGSEMSAGGENLTLTAIRHSLHLGHLSLHLVLFMPPHPSNGGSNVTSLDKPPAAQPGLFPHLFAKAADIRLPGAELRHTCIHLSGAVKIWTPSRALASS